MDNTTRFIFVSALFRSGTTLLTRALSAHPEIHVFYQPFFSLFKAATAKFWRGIGQERPRPMGDPLLTEHYFSEFRNHVRSLSFDAQEIESIKKSIWQDYEVDSEEKAIDASRAFQRVGGQGFFEILGAAMHHLREIVPDKRIVGIKEIWCEDFFPALLEQEVLPLKCIHLVRDPRAVVVSRNYGKYVRDGCGGQKYPILFIARAWRRALELRNRLRESPHYYFLRYEDLVIDPGHALSALSEFLGVPFDPVMLDYTRYRGGDGRAWTGNVNSRKLESIDGGSAGRWQDIISDDDLSLCEFLCEQEMKELGYPPRGAHLTEERFLSLEEDESSSGSWLGEFGHCLTETQKQVELRGRRRQR